MSTTIIQSTGNIYKLSHALTLHNIRTITSAMEYSDWCMTDQISSLLYDQLLPVQLTTYPLNVSVYFDRWYLTYNFYRFSYWPLNNVINIFRIFL